MSTLPLKIKTQIPNYIHEILHKDIYSFNMKKNTLCNLIFENLYNDHDKWSFNREFSRVVQFRLHKSNNELFKQIWNTDVVNTHNRSEYFRNLFATYVNFPAYIREKKLYRSDVQCIERAIKNKKNIIIDYNDEKRKLEPYLIINNTEEEFNYLFGYCYKHGEYRNYRLSNVSCLSVVDENWEHEDREYLNKIKNNFDPFLSHEKEIKVKFTDEGLDLFENVIYHNRPKILEKKGNIYTLECSYKKAEAYFGSFFDKVEILSPSEIRDKFKKNLKKTLKKYKK
ncbi:MAG: WYL domain-containing protein [Candidatus Mcinerneyibacterium aminivorans]|uniref:WYL domain-containing protein n=1 Tax=Candidatus Mcinerneyibacterium aminivorans TaxID=2703815 RepID=A0A5D0MKI3_9BACT|nr:MAG: WYL domain-containing protein [Candidatus Mcinerneyibacterium aminivorans]